MFYKYHRKSPWLKRVLVPFWAFQLIFMLALVSASVYLRTYTRFQTTDIIVLIICAICSILSITEIILFAATRLYPLAYLILQLVKTITWFVLFVLASIGTMRARSEMKAKGEQGYSLVILSGFVETLVLFITFLSALIYASITYHRHRLTKSRFLHSIHSTDLLPVLATEEDRPTSRHQAWHALPRNSIKDAVGPGAGLADAAEMKEGIEMTVLRELGSDWEVYELPATKSKRSSRGGRSVKSLKGVR